MALNFSITIGGDERKNYILKNQLVWRTEKNGKADQLNFVIFQKDPSENLLPQVDDDVVFTVNSEILFKGNVVDVNQKVKSKQVNEIQVTCIDYTWEANKGEPVAEIYRDETAEGIINDIVTRYPQLSSFTQNNIDANENVNYLFLDYERFSNVLKRLSDMLSYNFYIDKDKDIHFFKGGGEGASFEITDENQKLVKESLNFTEDGDEIKNYVVVEGGEYDASELDSETFTATGGEAEFDLAGRYSGVQVTVNGSTKTIGIFGINEPGIFDFLYDFSGRKLVIDQAAISGGDSVVLSGYQKIPVIIQIDDPVQIAKYGVLSTKIKNTSLKTKGAAISFAKAQLERYSSEAFGGSFATYSLGLRAGQRMRVQSNALNIDKYFDVQSTSTKFFSNDQLITQVKVASAEKTDAIALLAKLSKQSNFTSSASQFLNLLKYLRENVGVSDQILIDPNKKEDDEEVGVSDDVQKEENKPMTWVFAKYIPTGFADDKRQFTFTNQPFFS